MPCAFGLVLPLCLACVFLSIPSSRGWARAKESSSERRSGCAQGPANTLPSLGWAGLGSAWAPRIQKGRDGRGQIPERKLSHLLVRLPACCHGNPSHFLLKDPLRCRIQSTPSGRPHPPWWEVTTRAGQRSGSWGAEAASESACTIPLRPWLQVTRGMITSPCSCLPTSSPVEMTEGHLTITTLSLSTTR